LFIIISEGGQVAADTAAPHRVLLIAACPHAVP